MIEVTKLNSKKFTINSDLIESVESTPDTTISMTTGKKIMVTETIDEVVDKVIAFRQKLHLPAAGGRD